METKQREDKEVTKSPQRNYIEPVKVHILNHLLLVTKTIGAERVMVYYGNSREVNHLLW